MFRLTVVILSCAFFYGTSVAAVEDILKDRIIGGDKASINDYPFQCSLQKLDDNHACGCSILNDKVLLTAAHCLVGATQSDINHMKVRCGSAFWSTGGVLRTVESVLLHPSYDTDSMANDVALIKLSSPLVFSSTIKKVKLATSNPSEGTPVNICGWGYKQEDKRAMVPQLQEVKVNYVSGKTCSSSLYKYLKEIKDGMVCGVAEGKDACQGDSGGPLTFEGEQIGIVSWGYGCDKPGYPGIYSDVVYFRSWITKNAESI